VHFQEDSQQKENSNEINGEVFYTKKHFEEKSGKKQNKKTEMTETKVHSSRSKTKKTAMRKTERFSIQ
jgi:hypothetical protein